MDRDYTRVEEGYPANGHSHTTTGEFFHSESEKLISLRLKGLSIIDDRWSLDVGSDTENIVIALCLQCHNRLHHCEDGEKYNQNLNKEIKIEKG